MATWNHRVWSLGLAALAIAAAVAASPLAQAAKLNPHSPMVEKAVAKAIAFLESDAARDGRMGAAALVGLALLKNGTVATHPKVVAAAETIRNTVGQQDPQTLAIENIYSAGLAIIFLVTLDPSKHHDEISRLLAYLAAKQKPHGGWGYPDRETGDTSMTQYAVLSYWEATQAGFAVPRESLESVATWLIKTQDPSGGFGYQGTVASMYSLVKQTGMRPSMSAAGLGSVYICSNLLGFSERVRRDDDLPPALQEVRVENPAAAAGKGNVDPRRLRSAQSMGNAWLRANTRGDPPPVWVYYYLYALERYWSFREAVEGEKDASWYSDGARYLFRTQAEDGSWSSRDGMSVPDTAFGVLFLLRSSKKSIERAYSYGAGVMVAGRGLPRDTARVDLKNGRLIARPSLATARQWMAALDDPSGADFAAAADLLANLAAADAPALLAAEGSRLVRLAARGAPPARIAALRVLSHSRNLDYAPVLILALGDAHPGVMRAGERGLQWLSRKLGTAELPDQPTEAARRKAIDEWKAWCSAVRPDMNFLN